MGRPAKKKRYAEAKATRKGELQAEYEFKRQHSIIKKPLDFLEENLKGAIAKVEPFDALAMVGMTYVVHGIIKASPEMMEKVKVLQHPEFLLLGGFGVVAAQFLPLPEGVMKKAIEQTPDWFVWLESFAIAYIVIRHGGQLVGLLDKGLGAVVPLFLGM